MTHQTFRYLLTLAFTFSLLLPASLTAQIGVATDQNDGLIEATPVVTEFHFTDKSDDRSARMTTDAAGNFFVAAGIGSSSHRSGLAVLKYKFNGEFQGAFRYKLTPGDFQGTALDVKVDKDSNIYAAGFTVMSGEVVSFTPSGAQRWAAKFDGQPLALAIDQSGNIYAAGSGGGGTSLVWVLVKYSSTGQVLWEQHHTGIAGDDSRVTDMQLDSLGSPIVLGTTSNSLAKLTNNMTVAKYDPSGNLLWAKDFSAVANESQIPGGLAIDGSGSVYATGATNPPEGLAMPFTVKYDNNGNLVFVLSRNGAGGTSVALDPSGNILLTGQVVNFGTVTSTTASKIRPSGAQIWLTPITATGKIVSDSVGHAFIAGSFNSNYLITKLTPKGKEIFESRFALANEVTDAVVDPFGNLLVTGTGVNAIFEDDIFTLRLK
ncbi:MAG TPA: hypothetical protein VKR59_00315 [Terriglobales bacterium]|nr:hypothetical protein [Terriglobales bacterium]